MADPMTLGMVAMGGAQVFGTALQVKGMTDQADTYSRLADIDTQVLNQNAEYAEEQGALALAEGYEQGKEIRTAGRRLQSEQRAVVGGSGLKVDVGSPLLLAMESARLTEFDALTSEWEGRAGKVMSAREASEQRRQAALTQYDKALNKKAMKEQRIGTIVGSGMNIISGGVKGMGPALAGK